MNKRRILIVDDDPDLLHLLEHSIASYCAECEVVRAADGHAALEQLEAWSWPAPCTAGHPGRRSC